MAWPGGSSTLPCQGFQVQGEPGHEKREDPVEALRRQCLQEAEQQFLVRCATLSRPRLTLPTSLHVPEIPGGGGGVGGKLPCPWPCPPGINLVPNGAGGLPAGQALPGYWGLHGRGGPGWVGYGGDLEGVGENLRTIELPQLPGDATSLVFGDWLAMLEPVVAELSQQASQWRFEERGRCLRDVAVGRSSSAVEAVPEQ